MTSARKAEIQAEALRQMESCLYTSTMLFMWLRPVRWQHKAIVLLPILLTAFAGFSYAKDAMPAWAVAMMGFVAALLPAIAKALDIETHVDELRRLAGDYKSLQDRFRILAKVSVHKDEESAEATLMELMDRLDVARSSSITPPERYFRQAQRKIKSGDYDFSIDLALRSQERAEPLDRPA